MNFFEELIQKLGEALHTPLHAEKGYLCKLRIHDSLKVQIEHDSSSDQILMASFLIDLPPGKFREDTLKEALKANSQIDAFGTFAYSEKQNSLVLFLYLPSSIDAELLQTALSKFIEKAMSWIAAIQSGNLSSVATSLKRSSSFFNL
jgi:hypothetical protein